MVSLFLPTFAVQADEESSNTERGRLNMDLDRISGGNRGGEQVNKETELERTFPELFREETKETIVKKQLEQAEWFEEIQQSIFEMESQSDTTVAHVLESLFTDSYTAPSSDSRINEEEFSEGASNVLLFSIIGLVTLVGGFVFMMMRQVMD